VTDITRLSRWFVEAGAHASRRLAVGGWLIIAASVAVPGSSASGTGAEDTAECWRDFFRTQGIEQPLGEIATFSFLGHRLHVPGAYLWRGLPRTELAEQGAVWLMAWGPQLAPVTATQADEWRQARPTRVVRMTMFGHPNFLHGQALLDAMTRDDRYESWDGERDAHGFTVLRPRRADAFHWGEIHISPQGPDEMFHCVLDGQVRNPGCTAQRWIGGPLRVEMHFNKSLLLAEYPAISSSSAGFFRCALGTHGVPGQVWPAR
jgi:hypothetical protein